MTAHPIQNQDLDIQEFTHFLMEYALALVSCGAYTTRVVRCVRRMGNAFGYEIYLSIFSKSINMTVTSKEDYNIRRTYIKGAYHFQISFKNISLLSALSWDAIDEHLSFQEVQERFTQITTKHPANWQIQLLLIGIGNAAFCKLFGGDLGSFLVVFFSTMLGFGLKKFLEDRHVDMRLIFIICSFFCSLVAYLSYPLALTKTIDVAVASSVLFLIPGVRLLNSVIDILDGHVMVGVGRGINTGILIACIGIGIYMSLKVSGVDVL